MIAYEESVPINLPRVGERAFHLVVKKAYHGILREVASNYRSALDPGIREHLHDLVSPTCERTFKNKRESESRTKVA